MPFDGLLATPYRVQLELFRRREVFSLDPAEAAEALLEKKRVAGESFVVLCQLLKLFDGGKNWRRGRDWDCEGNFCLRGGIAYLRSKRGNGDRAGVYISRAIRETGDFRWITAFNDDCTSYSEIRVVVERARLLAAEGTL